ncbi:CPBP family intramembrane metalloprotease [Shouchella clausii]|uniref:CPBP family intramembrane glutamic endopeptidase n=1 Tax=Shouchella clausii TaxID=79880 RepID=UPI002DC0607C|nr:CPBP family intramembrane glutamic endopeptidase [Shouchella clausii]MEB5481760.1 CPBP family intramembrane metalloprotease [Shouchella clausii]
MSKLTTHHDRIKTGWILASTSILLTTSILSWFIGNPKRFIETRMGIHEGVFADFYVWLFTFIIVIGYVVYTIIALPFVRAQLFNMSWLKIIGVWAALATGIVEEVLFRHLLMDFLQSFHVSEVLQIILSGIIFGFAHGAWGIFRRDAKIVLPVIISTTILGCFLATLYIMSGRSTFAPIVAHVLINLIIEPWLMLSAISGKWTMSKLQQENT